VEANSQPWRRLVADLGIVAFVGAHFWGAPMWLTRGLYVAAILTGGGMPPKTPGRS